MNHPYNHDGTFKRLYIEYLKYGTLYIAFDFDNTIWDHDKYGNQYDYYAEDSIAFHEQVINLLKKCKELGMKLILWTSCSSDEEENKKNDICKYWGIEPDYLNWSPLSPGAKKPHFNLLLDDRAGLEEAYEVLEKLVMRIELDKYDNNR